MVFNRHILILTISFGLIACNKEGNPSAVQTIKDIGSESAENRVLKVYDINSSYNNAFYAEFHRNIVSSSYRGYEFNLFDSERKDVTTTMRILRLRNVGDTTEIFPNGTYYTNSLLINPSTDVIVELETYVDGIKKNYRATEYKPKNKIIIDRPDSNTVSIDLSLEEMRSNFTGVNRIFRANGRILIRNRY